MYLLRQQQKFVPAPVWFFFLFPISANFQLFPPCFYVINILDCCWDIKDFTGRKWTFKKNKICFCRIKYHWQNVKGFLVSLQNVVLRSLFVCSHWELCRIKVHWSFFSTPRRLFLHIFFRVGAFNTQKFITNCMNLFIFSSPYSVLPLYAWFTNSNAYAEKVLHRPVCSSLFSVSSLRHERAQAVCGQRAKPVWDGPHRAPGSPLPQDRGQLGQATRHRLVLVSCIFELL